MIRKLFFILILCLPLVIEAQPASIIDTEAIHAIIIENLRKYPNCPCPYSVDSAGIRCGSRSVWSRFRGLIYCYPTEVPPELIIQSRSLHVSTSPHSMGVVTQIVRHSILSPMVATTGLDTNMASFVVNGILYHPIVREGCAQITIGMPLNIVTVHSLNKIRFGTNAVIFLLPDNARCLAISLGPVAF